MFLAVQLAGVLRHLGGQVQRPEDRHAAVDHRLAGLGQLAIAAPLGGQVDDHRARRPSWPTISAVTSTGAFLPGTAAVVITTSLSATTRSINSRCLR